jgi:hypothetical protein
MGRKPGVFLEEVPFSGTGQVDVDGAKRQVVHLRCHCDSDGFEPTDDTPSRGDPHPARRHDRATDSS